LRDLRVADQPHTPSVASASAYDSCRRISRQRAPEGCDEDEVRAVQPKNRG